MAELSTRAQVVADSGGANTMRIRIYAWYDGQSDNKCWVHIKLTVVNQGVTYTGTNKAYYLRGNGYWMESVGWGYAPLNPNTEYGIAEYAWQQDGGTGFWAEASLWTYVYGSVYCSSSGWSVPSFYGPPNAPSAWNLESNGEPHTAHAKIQTGYWGLNSSRKWYEVLNSAKNGTYKYDYNNEPGDLYWPLPYGSNDTLKCGVIKWYGRAYNNHDLRSDSGAMYIATPSAPILTITPGSGTTPKTTISGTVTYKGGTQNSTTCNNGTIKRWSFGKLLSSESGVPKTFQYDERESDTTKAFTWNKDNFATGNNYKFYVRSINNYGGTSSSTTNAIYCPTGVSGSLSSRTTETLTLKGSCNSAGTINSASGGTISCYEIKWSTDKTTVDEGGGTSSGLQTNNTFTIDGLVNDQTVYYRVYAWNVYGLSNVSSTLSATTLPRYNPSLSNISATPLSPGGDVSITIDRTGGMTANELIITSIEFSRRPSSSSTYTVLKTIDDLELRTGDSYTIKNAWTDVATSEGNYTYRIHLSNGVDVSDTYFTLNAPTSVTATAGLQGDEPIQISAKGNATSAAQLYKWELISTSAGWTKTLNTSSTTPTIITSNHLNYDTRYLVKMRAYNSYGLWRDSMTTSVQTKPRFQFYSVTKDGSKKADALFLSKTSSKKVSEVYYIVKNSLGNVKVGDDLYNKRLKFITQSLRYRPENVASINLSDGRRLAYAYDSTNDLYKFGIWRGENLETVFHDGWNWRATEYAFEESVVVTSISENLNASAAFSTTKCEDTPLWEQDIIDGCARVFYYTDDTYTTTNKIDIADQNKVKAMCSEVPEITLISKEGTNFTLDNTISAKISDIQLKGNNFQTTYSGKNLAPPIGRYSWTGRYGSEILEKQENFIRFAPIGTYSGISLQKNTICPQLWQRGNWFFANIQTLSSPTTIAFGYDGETMTQASIGPYYNGWIAFPTKETNVAITIYVISNWSNTNPITLRNMQVTSGTTMDTQYEPYVGGISAPNAGYPQTIKTVTGAQTISLRSGDRTDGTTSQPYPIELGDIELCKVGSSQDKIYKKNGDWYLRKEVGKTTDTSGSTSIIIPGMVGDGEFYSYYGGTVSDTTITYSAAIPGKNAIYYQLTNPTEAKITDTTLLGQLNALADAYSYDGSTVVSSSASGSSLSATVSATASSQIFEFGDWSVDIDRITITNDNIKNIVLTNSVTSLPDCFLANSPHLQSAILANANTTSVGDYTCFGCSNLLTTSLPNPLTAIPNYIFYDCANLNTLLDVPPGVKSIGKYFMAFCVRQSQQVNLPEGLETIGDYFMSGCGIFDQPITIPSTVTSIGNYFMSANLLFDRDLVLPSGLAHLGSGFLYNCLNMTRAIDVGELDSDVAIDSNYTLSALYDTAACYVTGISIKGANNMAWLEKFDNRDTSPYRYTKEYVEPIIENRNWDAGTTLDGTTITKKQGEFGYLPYSDVHNIRPTADFMALLDTDDGSDYRTLFQNIDNYDTLYDIENSAEFPGYTIFLDSEGVIVSTYAPNPDSNACKIIKNPTLGILWTGQGSTGIAEGNTRFWQGRYSYDSYSYISIMQGRRSQGTATITSEDLKNLSNISDYYIATWAYWNGEYIIYLSDITDYDAETGTATFYVGATTGPIMLFEYALNIPTPDTETTTDSGEDVGSSSQHAGGGN